MKIASNREPIELPADSPQLDEHESDIARMRFVFSKWILICVMMTTALLLFSVFGLLMWQADNRERLIAFIFAHASVATGIPFSAAIAMFVVLMLRTTQGPVEFEVVGFKFRGASGPIIMWVLCFLVIIAATKLLWSSA